MKKFHSRDLKRYATDLLHAGGYAKDHAKRSADILVWANARGAESHGVLRIPRYLEMVAKGIIDPVACPTIESQEGAVSILEAARAPGPSAMITAIDTAVSIAENLGIGWCSARNITHAGAVGYYALRAAEKGYLGIVMTASGPLMAYHGSRVAGLSTNPISIAAPSNARPILLDMSTSTVALGKIMHAKDTGASLPEGWAINSEGLPATNPADVATLTPLGGAKGSGLSLMIEVLASILVTNPVIATALSGGKGSMNGVALALKIEAFGQKDIFVENIAQLTDRLKGLPRAVGTNELLMPGERGFRMSDERITGGIPIADGTLERLAAVANKFDIPQPKPWVNS